MSTTGSNKVSTIRVNCKDQKNLSTQFDHVLTEDLLTEVFPCQNCGSPITIQKETPQLPGGQRLLLGLLAIPLVTFSCCLLMAVFSLFDKNQDASMALLKKGQ